MKKISFTVFLMIVTILNAIEVIQEDNVNFLTLEQLQSMTQVMITTERSKNEETRIETWLGVSLKSILAYFDIHSYNRLRISAFDNYQVHLGINEIRIEEPILALQIDQEVLPVEKVRLVSSQLNNMYWIQNIKEIVAETGQNLPLPAEILFAEPILSRKPLSRDLQPFVDATGFTFQVLADEVFPFLEGEYLIVGKDGISHLLEFEEYLSKAFLVLENNRYTLKSPQMPAGMWLKGITYIQKDDLAVVFAANVRDVREIATIAGWEAIPSNIAAVTASSHIFIDPDTNFEDMFEKKITGILLP